MGWGREHMHGRGRGLKEWGAEGRQRNEMRGGRVKGWGEDAGIMGWYDGRRGSRGTCPGFLLAAGGTAPRLSGFPSHFLTFPFVAFSLLWTQVLTVVCSGV